MLYYSSSGWLKLESKLKATDSSSCVLVMFPDADSAGEHSTSRSTGGCWIELQSACGSRCWPLVWTTRKQTSTAFSTCEAETISLATAFQKEALPLQSFFEHVLKRTVHLRCEEDNSQAVLAASGYSPVLRHLVCTQSISIGVLGETFVPDADGSASIVHCETIAQKGDLLTKRLDTIRFELSVG